MTAIRTEHLTHTYSQGTPFEKVAVEDVSISIEEGEYVGVIGHTGSGKSTLIQHLNGLLAPTSGKVYIGEKDLWADKSKLRAFRFQVGLVFQYPEYQLFGETVYSDIAFGPTNMGLTPEEVDSRVRQAARFVGLSEDKLQKSPFELSGGQKRRVAIAGVLAMDPRVLILDEPTAGLDPKGRDKILGEIREYHQEKKNTVLLVSHSMEDIAKNATMAMVMNKSRLFCYDTVENVFGRAEELGKMGLAVPQVSRVFLDLRADGLDVDTRVYTVEAARDQILRKARERGLVK
jgi:energy-coupling factor transport system ATP-binding protein